MRSLKPLVLASVLALGSASVAASPFKFVLGLSGGGGGDELVEVSYDNGETDTISAGGGVQFFGGFEYQLDSIPLALQFTVGYHTDSTSASNGEVSFTRVPLEGLALWQLNESVRLGGGLRLATGAELSSSGAASYIGNYSFDSKPGVVLQAELTFSERSSVYLRGVMEKFDYQGVSYSGNHIGLGFSFRF